MNRYFVYNCCNDSMRPRPVLRSSLRFLSTCAARPVLHSTSLNYRASRVPHARSSATATTPDPRFGTLIKDKFAHIRDDYGISRALDTAPSHIDFTDSRAPATPKNAIVLAHGLLGFDEIRLAGPFLPAIQYWRGIRDALALKGIEVITTSVPPYGTIEKRAEALAMNIVAQARGKDVNIIA